MALSRRLRYEIMRRDNHACRYCGASAPGTALQIDHVLPVALGGGDEPENLVAACADCNSGKNTTPPGAPLVDDVSEDAIRWARAIAAASEIQRARIGAEQHVLAEFDQLWTSWGFGPEGAHPCPRPRNWSDSVERFRRAGADQADFQYAFGVAMRSPVGADRVWPYFCGVMWRLIRERQEIATQLIAADDGEVNDAAHPIDQA